MDEQFLTVTEVAQLLHISRSHAYKVIHRLNQELKAQDQLAWVGAMNAFRQKAEEIVLEELIYS